MKKIFYNGTEWLAFEAPEKPRTKITDGKAEYINTNKYEKAYAEAKANALPVLNPELITITSKYPEVPPLRPPVEGKDYNWHGDWKIKEVETIEDGGGCYVAGSKEGYFLSIPEVPNSKNEREETNSEMENKFNEASKKLLDKAKTTTYKLSEVPKLTPEQADKVERIFSRTTEEILNELESTDDAYYHHSQIAPVIQSLLDQLKEKEGGITEPELLKVESVLKENERLKLELELHKEINERLQNSLIQAGLNDRTIELSDQLKENEELINRQSRLLDGKQRAIAHYAKERDDLFEQVTQMKEALKELIPLAQNHASTLKWDEEYSGDQVGGKEAQAIVDKSSKLI